MPQPVAVRIRREIGRTRSLYGERLMHSLFDVSQLNCIAVNPKLVYFLHLGMSLFMFFSLVHPFLGFCLKPSSWDCTDEIKWWKCEKIAVELITERLAELDNEHLNQPVSTMNWNFYVLWYRIVYVIISHMTFYISLGMMSDSIMFLGPKQCLELNLCSGFQLTYGR